MSLVCRCVAVNGSKRLTELRFVYKIKLALRIMLFALVPLNNLAFANAYCECDTAASAAAPAPSVVLASTFGRVRSARRAQRSAATAYALEVHSARHERGHLEVLAGYTKQPQPAHAHGAAGSHTGRPYCMRGPLWCGHAWVG